MPNRQPKLAEEEIVHETGRTLHQWFSELKSRKLEVLGLKQLKRHLQRSYDLDLEWASKLAKAYLQTVDRQHKSIQYEVSVRKTYSQPIEQIFERTKAWFDQDDRAELPSSLEKQSIQCRWTTDGSNVDVRFSKKGEEKTQIIIQHAQLESSMDADVMRNFWRQNLQQMAEAL